METYKCIPFDRIIIKTNKLNHEITEFHINKSLNKDNPSYKTCANCKRVQVKTNFYDEKSKCKNCLKEYRKRNVECKIFNTITFRNYFKHLKSEKQMKRRIILDTKGKIYSKYNKEQAESKITYDSIKHIECTICDKLISKTNWAKHEKMLINNERLFID
jgi:hypothetical protein